MLLSMCFMSSRAGSTWQNARSATSRGGEAGALDGGVDALGMGGEEVLAERWVGQGLSAGDDHSLAGTAEKRLIPLHATNGLPDGGGPARYLPGRVWAGGLAVFPRPLT